MLGQGSKKKIGVGRKLSYGKEVEEEILLFGLRARESEGGLVMSEVKGKAMEMIEDRHGKFKASDGWYKKFCCRNKLNMKDKFDPPIAIPM